MHGQSLDAGIVASI